MTAHADMDTEGLRQRLAELISQATSGAIPVSEALAGSSLRALGLDSLSALRLIDAIDLEYGVEIDIGGALGPDTLDDVVANIVDRLA
ncbi:acyl carrier protein [Allorhizocola rhizosphaerae]|uniref:acyl carrier protein n=1 Tax=Allorhizocola rhizosphaerae TaxID=1872709 RepID=UPI001B8AFDB0|nr:acyl carrier protein [Allorhizocola rhizosphaerae]